MTTRNRSSRMTTTLLLFAFLYLNSVGLSQTTQSVWTPEELIKIKAIGNVRVSPHGMRALFTVREAVMTDDKSEFVTQVWMADADGAEAIQLTTGEKSSTNPKWSPDGKWIAFTSSRSGKNNIWLIRSSAGEARQLTDAQGGLGDYNWAPDSKTIAYIMSEPETDEEKKNKKAKNDAQVVDENFKMNHLWTISIEGEDRTARQITSGAFNVARTFTTGFDWSPDGKSIVFTHNPTPLVNDWTDADISIVDVASGEIKALAKTNRAESHPLYSPNGQWIAYRASDDPPTWGFTSRVYIVASNGGSPKPLANSSDERPSLIGWSANGQQILVSETQRTVTRLSALPIDGSPQVDLTPADVMVSQPALNPSREFIGFVSETPDTPSEAFMSPLADFRAMKLSAVQRLPELPIGKTETLQWRSKDGESVEGLLTYPVAYKSGVKVPLLVVVHGGPAGVFTQRFIGNRGAYPIAAFASRGYAVLRCNVRGSSGYGQAFRYANYSDWGGGDFQDIMSGVDHLIKKGIADPDRMGIMGWSYGGYMTSWVITQTDRFKAASVGAGVTNLMSFTGTSDVPGFVPDYFGGEYWEVFDKWRSHSAMFNMKGVTTPTLIQHGEKDIRVPVTQGYELYNAIKRQGVEVKMVVYPRQPHGIREPRLLLDAMQRNLDWFEKWLLSGEKMTAN
ncbi:S9 family peptidase [bacterium]|nr:S9 family peptidase [bacterium]